ncbi:hypothetical protein LAZ67_4001538 [Cordylochernes scorpioides]|uniref:Reverse transcriptase domain-containing protein n=1 Tax=Cordylochernes scorpioides TaxID=51811 RepID=A0ABY6KC80_9ARAC|nr:hypothetical protein LAZ67_4001538 [Cordylochernes scorpioides]
MAGERKQTVESILQAKEEEETDQVDEEVDPIVHIPHPKEVLESIQTLRLFLQCQDESKSLHRHLSDLDNIEKSVQHLVRDGGGYIERASHFLRRRLEDDIVCSDSPSLSDLGPIHRLPNGRASGWDGSPFEFVKRFLRRNSLASLRGFSTPRGLASIFKVQQGHPAAENARWPGLQAFCSISLPTTDYGFLSGVLMGRLRRHLPNLVPDCQTYAVPEPSSSWNIALVYDEAAGASRHDTPLAVISLDLKSHAAIGIGDVHTRAFLPFNEVGQGCRLSAVLFIIGVGPLLRRLERILGHSSAVAYADDIVLFIMDDAHFELLCRLPPRLHGRVDIEVRLASGNTGPRGPKISQTPPSEEPKELWTPRGEDSKEPIESDPDYESGENTTFPKRENTLGRTQEIAPSQEDATPPPAVSDVLGSLTRTLHQLSAATGLSRDVELPRYDGSYEAQSFFDNYDAQADLALLQYTERLRRLPNLLHGKALHYFRSLKFDKLYYVDARQDLIDLFPETINASFDRFLAIKLSDRSALEEYYQKRTVCGLQLNLPHTILLESLTDGLPVADQRIVAAVQPNTLQEWYRVVYQPFLRTVTEVQCSATVVSATQLRCQSTPFILQVLWRHALARPVPQTACTEPSKTCVLSHNLSTARKNCVVLFCTLPS